MRLSRRALDVYNAAVKKCGNDGQRVALSALDAWFGQRPDATIAETREFCISMLRRVGTEYGEKAGDAAYAMRAIVADAMGVELPETDYAYEPDPERVGDVPRYQVEKLKAGDVDGFKRAIADAARYFSERGANDTMAALGRRDAKKLGSKVRFARIPTGATTCPYCCMLASRGFVYSSELAALNANHRNCDCRIVEGFAGMEVEGYDPDRYYDMWKHPEKYENAEVELSEDAEYYKTIVEQLKEKGEKQEQRALARAERDHRFKQEALAGSSVSVSKLEAFYDGADELYFKAKMFEARGDGIAKAIEEKPDGDREYFNKAEIEAAQKFAAGTVTVPSEITGRSTNAHPREADMRGYFDSSGNPINFTQRGGPYNSWKTWGKAFADKEKKRRQL